MSDQDDDKYDDKYDKNSSTQQREASIGAKILLHVCQTLGLNFKVWAAI